MNKLSRELTREEIADMIRADKDAAFAQQLMERYTNGLNKQNQSLLGQLRSK